MKINKIQQEIFKHMINRERRLFRAEISEGSTAFTFDGYRAFVLPKGEIQFDASKIPMSQDMANLFTKREKDKALKITDSLKILPDKRFVRKLSCTDGKPFHEPSEASNVWVNEEYIKPFLDTATDVFSSSEKDRVLIYEYGNDEPVAVILPIRVSEK